MEDDDLATSNPLPPPPRPSGQGRRDAPPPENLSNQDFRKMVMDTPRRGQEKSNKDRSKGGEVPGEEGEEGQAYRDRAKERREEKNPDYVGTGVELIGSLSAVAPPGTTDLRFAEANKISIENSKFLGVRLLLRVVVLLLSSAMDVNLPGEQQQQKQQDRAIVFRSASAKVVYQHLVRPHLSHSKVNEMFLPGRTQFVYDMDEDFRSEIPTTVHRSKSDCPAPPDTVAVAVDAPVLDRISKIMAYLRMGSSGKVLKKKKKDKDKLLMPGLVPTTAADDLYGASDSALDADVAANGNSNGKELPPGGEQQGLLLPPPPPRPLPREPEEDIFGDVGTDYEPTRAPKSAAGSGGRQAAPAGGSSGLEVAEMDQSSRDRNGDRDGRQGGDGRRQYFDEPSGIHEAQQSLLHPPPPPPPPGDYMGGAMPPPPPPPHQGAYDMGAGPMPGPAYPPQGGTWQDYPPPPPEHYPAGHWPQGGGQGQEHYGYAAEPYPGHLQGGAYQLPHTYPPEQGAAGVGGAEYYHSASANPPPPAPPSGYMQANEYANEGYASLHSDAIPFPPPGDPLPLGGSGGGDADRAMTQADRDRGMGSVFSRDDQRLGLGGPRDGDKRERADPAYVSSSYSECYPDYKGFTSEVAGSDDEDDAEDLSKMDMGGKAKGRLHRWDFESEEEWATYNESKEAMPKAAFQFGVKTADGRKTRKSGKDKENKLNNELNKINQILDRKKKEKAPAGGYDEGDEDPPGKRSRY
eukprot:jgi/Mesen1/4948/ME000247S04235